MTDQEAAATLKAYEDNERRKEEVFSQYSGNLEWLKHNTIFLCKHGSHAYGTNGPTSDVDIKGVAVAPIEYHLGFVKTFEQADKGFGEYDCCVYSLQKFMTLAADNNPNVIELAFIDEADWIYSSPAWQKIVANRDKLLSQNCKYRFLGYAMAQLKRIRTHREWLLHPPTHEPQRSEFDLPDFAVVSKEQVEAAFSQIRKQIDAWRIDLADVEEGLRLHLLRQYEDALTEIAVYSGTDVFTAAARKLSIDDNFMQVLERERAYRAKHTHWKQYNEWKRTRNPIRAELEAKYGYDTKHGMHLVRLMRMAREIITEAKVIVRRPDAEELKAVRNGAWSYEQLMEWAEKQEPELNALLEKTPLPKNPDRAALDRVCIEITEKML